MKPPGGINREPFVSLRGKVGQPWIGGCAFDASFILAPAYAITACVLCFPGFFQSHEVTPLLWALLIIGVDVAHVYSTLYRTYFDPLEFRRRRTLYLLVPVLGFLGFAALYSLGDMVFWRVLAYLAVFHFIRQQYGFMMIYRRDERRYPGIDKAAIYAATLPRRAGATLREALCDGEDYELAFGVAPGAGGAAFERAWRRAFPRTRLTCIGRFVRAGSVPPDAVHLGRFRGYEHLR